MDDVDISVLMCTFNRAEFLEDALLRLAAQSAKENHRFEIVVVDNGSTDQTRQVVCDTATSASVPIRYLFEPVPGIARARNRSVAAARGRWLAFIDDDELAEPDWLAELISTAESTGALIFGGTVLLNLPDSLLESLGRETRRSLRERGADRYGDRIGPCPPRAILGTGNLMLHRDVISKVGGFDETLLMGGEDEDLLIRARTHNFEVWYVPTAVVYHRIPETRFEDGYFKRDSLRSGVMLAVSTARHHGYLRLIFDLVARQVQAVLVTVPLMAKARVSHNAAELLDLRIKFWRAQGYAKGTLATVLPSLPLSKGSLRDASFREGRT